MKIQNTSTQPTFQPIEIKITIESEEELQNLLVLGEASSVIRAVLHENGCVGYDVTTALEFLLDDIAECL